MWRGEVQVRAYGLDLVLPRDSGSMSNYFYFGEYFEWETINFIDAYLRPGDVVADVGANVGMFAYAAARSVGADGRVVCFEPLSWAADVIERNVRRNGLGERLQVHRMAASDVEGTAEFAADLDVSSHIAWTNGPGVSRESVTVRTRRLDDVLSAVGGLALLKLDVEGAEWHALQGFKDHLASGNPPVIIIEAHDHSLRKMGSSRVAVLELLASNGYQNYSFDDRATRLTTAIVGASDLIAVHDSSAERVQSRLQSAAASSNRENRVDPAA